MSGVFFDGGWLEGTSRKCRRCGRPVFQSGNLEYSYQCFHCDEDLFRFETEEQTADYTPRIIVARHINGITLNAALEYILDASDELMVFPRQSEAESYLRAHGVTDEDMAHMYFIEYDNEPEGA